eukprot:m.5159 g.5159  ORF g.5159 m.5159 type:complete len:151 (-) comp4846_c0_seq1:1632-2084(-)
MSDCPRESTSPRQLAASSGEASFFDETIDATSMGITAGATWGAVKSAWEAKPEIGQRTGNLVVNTARTVAINAGALGVVAAVFQASKIGAESVRGKNDALNSFVGGCLAGSLAGAHSGNVARAAGGCFLVGAAAALTHVGLDKGGKPEDH